MSKNKNKYDPNSVEQKVSFGLLKTLLVLVQFVFVICCGVLLYGLMGDSIGDLFTKKQRVQVSQNSQPVGAYDDWDKIENGIHIRTGLAAGKGFEIVNATCTACHSAKLVTQNRATREGWQDMIRWMQRTQGLWELGENEPIILDYLAEHYAPEAIGRRANIDVTEVEWYILNLEEE